MIEQLPSKMVFTTIELMDAFERQEYGSHDLWQRAAIPETDWQRIACERTADLAKADEKIERLQRELERIASGEPYPAGIARAAIGFTSPSNEPCALPGEIARDMERKFIAAIQEADAAFEKAGATGTKTWVREFLLYRLEAHGLGIAQKDHLRAGSPPKSEALRAYIFEQLGFLCDDDNRPAEALIRIAVQRLAQPPCAVDWLTLRNLIGSHIIENKSMADTLAIALCTYFEDHPDRPDPDPQTEHGWGQWAEKNADRVMDELADLAFKRLGLTKCAESPCDRSGG